MAAKGAVAKQEITQKLFEAFPNAFQHDKDIRIPWVENGVTVEIKIAMTCAKENVGGNLMTALSDGGIVAESLSTMTDAEIENVRIMMEHLNL
jgi:uncharacterized alkaline shock family protein YloU